MEFLAAELLPESSLFLAEIIDDRVLLTGHPAGEGGHENLPGLNDGSHLVMIGNATGDRQLSTNSGKRLELPGLAPIVFVDRTGLLCLYRIAILTYGMQYGIILS